jgi:hypothetical protein
MPSNSSLRSVMLGATACIFAGCSSPGSVTPPGQQAPNAVRTTTSSGFTSPEVKRDERFLYISDFSRGVVEIYPVHGRNQSPIGQITMRYPSALAVANNGDLFVSASLDSVILAFHKGATAPFETLTGGSAFGLTFDPAGNLYADTGSNAVNVYAPGATSPTKTLFDGNISLIAGGDAVTAGGDVFLVGDENGPPFTSEVDEFPVGSSNATKLPIVLQGGGDGLAVDDANNLIVMDPTALTVSVYAPPYTNAAISTFSLGGRPSGIGMGRKDKTIWISNNPAPPGRPEGHKYRATTGALVDSTHTLGAQSATGIAVSPSRR